tara:strand:+ start:117 stop:983 length:867 start_codon:yes stop_codon:yes gene_type:complete
MNKKISYFIYKLVYFFNLLYFFLFKKNFLFLFYDFIQKDSYIKKNILKKKINFFTPNELTRWRVETFFDKEPETIEWINSFDDSKAIIFWDIGANIGLFSIYNSLKNKKSCTISFEPSTSNLKVLSRNISINNLKNISIFPIALSDKKSGFFRMNESKFMDGGALNTFGEKYDFEGKNFKPEMSYNLYGANIEKLLDNKFLNIPNYIKIDVDGIEHLILKGMGKYLRNPKIKSILVEVNENFQIQFKTIISLMRKNNFSLLYKKNNVDFFKNNEKHKKTFNYIFKKIR